MDPDFDLLSLRARVRDILPRDFRVHEELGKGSNNKVLRVTWDGDEVILRVPRRKSDTQQRGSAKWEYLHTLLASNLEVGPRLRRAWFSRHSEDGWPSGLYMVMDHYSFDLETLIMKHRRVAVERREEIGAQIVSKIECMAKNNLLLYDLKPSNIVINASPERLDVRIIDYGKDFCEWDPGAHAMQVDVNTPVLSIIRTLSKDDEERVRHVAFATMLVQLSSVTTRHIYEDRRKHRMDRAERCRVNPTAPLADRLLKSMQGRNVHLLREILRTDPIRSVLQHYHGKRNAGTRRTLQFAVASVC